MEWKRKNLFLEKTSGIIIISRIVGGINIDGRQSLFQYSNFQIVSFHHSIHDRIYLIEYELDLKYHIALFQMIECHFNTLI